MNEKMSKRRIEITDLQKQEIEEKQEIRLLIRLHIFYYQPLVGTSITRLEGRHEVRTKEAKYISCSLLTVSFIDSVLVLHPWYLVLGLLTTAGRCFVTLVSFIIPFLTSGYRMPAVDELDR